MKNDTIINQEFLETVERYYRNTMSSEEKELFEEKLKDATFKSKVEDIKTLMDGIEIHALKSQLNSYHDEKKVISLKDNKPKSIPFSFKKWAIAASILIAVSSFWWYQATANQRLYANYFYPDSGLPTTMSSTPNYEFYNAMVDYKQNNFTTAIGKWKKLHAKKPKNDTLNYFIGVSYLAQKDADNAILFLNETLTSPSSVFEKETYFYLGLSYLKKDNISKAVFYLKKCDTKEAQELLKKLQ